KPARSRRSRPNGFEWEAPSLKSNRVDPTRRLTETRRASCVRDRRRINGDSRSSPSTGRPPFRASRVRAPAEDEAFSSIWRDELMHRVWRAVEAEEKRNGQPVHTVVRFRTDHRDMPSHQVAERLTEAMGKPLTAEWVRNWLLRGRQVFADLLVAEVVA